MSHDRPRLPALTKNPTTALLKQLGLVTAAGLAAIGCLPTNVEPPTATAIFQPDPNHVFEGSSAEVTIAALTKADTVCYTIDGSAASYNNATCSGGTTQSLPADKKIALACDEGETDAVTLKTIKLAYGWKTTTTATTFTEQAVDATFTLNCTPPPADTDTDGVIDNEDNCPNDYNPDQADANGNGIGDACEAVGAPDADGDGRPDTADNCVYVWNVNQADADGDGLGNVCDTKPQGNPPPLWANDELAAAWVKWKDEVQCHIRCSDPTGAGDIGTYNCPGGGTANWSVSLEGLSYANSTFTYTNCSYTVTVNKHDYATDPDFLNANATVPMQVTLVANGQMRQRVAISGGNGNESGTVAISGADFTGSVTSSIVITNKARAGGAFNVGCTADPIAEEICAPGGTQVAFSFPNWACAVGACPVPVAPLADGDADGVVDIYDNCPGAYNPTQANADFDSVGDACDDNSTVVDSDRDGWPNDGDNCPNIANADQADADNDGIGDVCDPVYNPDADDDGVFDEDDNCPNTANVDQADADNDGEGDVCDATPNGPDSDGDGIANLIDNCPNAANANQKDSDGDGLGNACDTPHFYLLRAKVGRCLYDTGSDVQSTASCAAATANQQWRILAANGRRVFQNVSTSRCIQGDWAGGMNTTTCNTGNTYQQWISEAYGADTSYPLRLLNGNANFCIYTDGTGNVFGTLGNCGLAGTESNRQIGMYPWGDLTETPIQP